MNVTKQRKINIYNYIILFLLVFFIFNINTTFASSEHGSSLKINPSYPSPGSTVTANFTAPSIDTNTALVTWRVNGEVIQQSYGKNQVRFDVGEVGTIYKISVFTKDAKGKTASKSKIIQISDAAMIWEGNTYTPPFYKGRSLQSKGSSVSVVVLPNVINKNGIPYNKNELFYEWKINDSVIPISSGKGQNYVTLTNSKPMETFKIVLKIKDSKGTIRTVKTLIIPATQPKIMFYEDDPLVGVRYDKSIEKIYNIRSKESTIMVEPFYMSIQNRMDKNLIYSWTVSDQKYDNKGTITLGSDGKIFGTTNLNLIIQNNAFWFQNARKTTKIEFGQKEEYNWNSDKNPETTPL